MDVARKFCRRVKQPDGGLGGTENQKQIPNTETQRELLSQRTLSTDWIAQFHEGSHPSSSFVLPSPPIRLNINNPSTQQLQSESTALSSLSSQSDLVDDETKN